LAKKYISLAGFNTI